MGAVEQLIYAELQARILRNKYKPSPEERDALKKCRSTALRRAFLSGAAAGLAVWLLVSRPSRSHWGTLGLRRWNVLRQTRFSGNESGWNVGTARMPTSEQIFSADLPANQGKGGGGPRSGTNGSETSTSNGASGGETGAERSRVWSRGLLVACGTLVGAYYGAQSTGTRCLEDVLALGQRSAMANEIRAILWDAKISLGSREENISSTSPSEYGREYGTPATLPELNTDSKNQRPVENGTDVNLLSERAMLILRQGVHRDDIGQWLEKHDAGVRWAVDSFSAIAETPWPTESDSSVATAWGMTESNGDILTPLASNTANEDNVELSSEPSTDGYGQYFPLRPRIGPSLPEQRTIRAHSDPSGIVSVKRRRPLTEYRGQKPASASSQTSMGDEPRPVDEAERGTSDRVPWPTDASAVTRDYDRESPKDR
ncbi:hypothetical protein CCYA_CCYA08G2330 [Cyanidiococcus yangmingshanensis]|nr:hypothetical protein CCYA_CCYA08G2330 [Cyanidiococcus yangmingshanensis]